MTAVGSTPGDAKFVRRFITPEGADLSLRLATGGDRAGAFLVDIVIIVIALVVLTVVVSVLAISVGEQNVEAFGIIWLLGFFVLRNGWFIVFEAGPRAATPGKRVMGLRVAARDGGRLSFEVVLTRNFLREIEVFLPLIFLISASAAGDPAEGWVTIMGLIWTGIFLFFPLFNRDRLRLGDIVAGTWVVRSPRQSLAPDLAAAPNTDGFAFSREQVQAYGVKELQVLEDVLRRRDRRTMAAVAERIRGKIGWFKAPAESDEAFLTAYYAALRGRLEHRLLFGHRRRDKFDKA